MGYGPAARADRDMMALALGQARVSLDAGGVPVGAVLATGGDTTLYTTLSPCQMCSGAILLFQIPRVVVGEAQTYPGDLGFLAERGVEIVLLADEACVAVMREFQQRYPEVWSEDIGGR
jgi:cytosine/creatinine deaminase